MNVVTTTRDLNGFGHRNSPCIGVDQGLGGKDIVLAYDEKHWAFDLVSLAETDVAAIINRCSNDLS